MASIADFRAHVRSLLASRRHVIALGIDGVGYALAARTWPSARVTRARSVFPTTSSTAWLTSLTGESVDAHGIPGVVFTVDDALIDVYRYRGALGAPPREDVFGDARAAGYTPIAILGDLEDTECTWRDLLVHRAEIARGTTFYARGESDPATLADRLEAAIAQALAAHDGPCFVWCFVDVDRHVHHHGYDAAVVGLLARIDALAVAWSRDAIVVAHSDHGLVPTRHDPAIAAVLDGVGCPMGGAGRTRWLYVAPDDERRVTELLATRLPASIAIHRADALFAPGSTARRRVGSIVLVARGEEFLAADGYRYEHGSLTDEELDAAVATW